ncbi:MAG: 23S rRNA (guanosine(2251)-2'-O)-methyltransferase RlmB [Clostridiales bacterium]|jgi:23S rRNA (guanosine2251-2'-O)-methyltransferase|nr:23S rRNA (guanosine(2251)-2'-O)-methyltransferase RlmB [Clostridiales bacterium]
MKTEGKNAVLELIKSGRQVDKVLIQQGAEKGGGAKLFELIRQSGVKYQFAPKERLDRESAADRHQGFIAYTADYRYAELEELIAFSKYEGKPPLVVVLDGIEDPHNLGSIIRACECGGVHGIIIPKDRSAQVNETAIKVSAGAAHHIKVARVTNLASCIKALKENGFWVFGSDSEGESMYRADFSGAVALVIGSEGGGMRRLTRELCDKVVSIPMYGKVNSLNASVACGIIVYEINRKRLMEG